MQAIFNMKTPTTLNELQQVNGRITALGRFMSCLAKKCLPFFRALKNNKKFEWTANCQSAFEDVKRFLTSPPLLSRLVSGEDLYLYLSVGNESLASVLVREDKEEQSPIYYISKVLRRSELRYLKMDKLARALVHTSKKLYHYFQAHKIIVRTNQPLKKIL